MTDVTSNLDLISQSTNPSQAQLASDQLNKDFTFFLKMLTTQLQHQDPTEPMDVSQMTQQIATYSGVEQQIRTNTNLEKMMAQQKQSHLATAVSYIGKEVETLGNAGTLKYAQDGTETGTADFTYELPEAAETVTVNIRDENGAIVYSGSGAKAAGENTFRWNGYNSVTKTFMDAGDYSMEIVATDADGNAISGIANASSELTYAPTQYGQATFSYVLDEAAYTSSVTISNSAGAAVFQGQGPTAEGRNVVVWDGVNSFTGATMPAGKYTMTVKAKNEAGEDIKTTTYAVGIVNTVETAADGTVQVTVGDVVKSFDDIVAIREATPFLTTGG